MRGLRSSIVIRRIDNYDAFFMALGVVFFYAIPVRPRDVGNLSRALSVDLKRIGYY